MTARAHAIALQISQDVHDFAKTLDPGEALGAAQCLTRNWMELAMTTPASDDARAFFLRLSPFHLAVINALQAHAAAADAPSVISHGGCHDFLDYMTTAQQKLCDLAAAVRAAEREGGEPR